MEERVFLARNDFSGKIRLGQRTTREEVERLAEARKPLEDEIRALNEFLREKYEEVDKIELRASESLSELSEAEGYINTLEKRSNALESKIRAFESENLKLAQQNTRLTDLKIMSEGQVGQIKPKKGLLGNERVELTKEQFDEFKGLIYQSRNLIHQKELEVQQAKSQIPLRASKNGFEASLQRAKDKTKGESIDRLKSEIRGLKNENSVLRQQNDKMLGKLREFMPDKALKNFVSELKAIQPIVKIVKRVIEKGLGL